LFLFYFSSVNFLMFVRIPNDINGIALMKCFYLSFHWPKIPHPLLDRRFPSIWEGWVFIYFKLETMMSFIFLEEFSSNKRYYFELLTGFNKLEIFNSRNNWNAIIIIDKQNTRPTIYNGEFILACWS
jgi:hypothetical protein